MRPNRLEAVTSASLYKALVPEPPPPKIQLRLPTFPWPRIWGRLSLASLPQSLKEVGFNYISNILPTGERRHRLRLAPTPACDQCPAPMDNVLHPFPACSRVDAAWENLLYTASRLLGGPVPDADLLFLKFPISPSEIHIIFAVLTFADLVWSSRGEQTASVPLTVRAALVRAPLPSNQFLNLSSL